MDYKNEIKLKFQNEKIIEEYRIKSSKNIFIYLWFLFFLNYFFVGAKFFDEFFLITLPYVYFCFLVSFWIFSYFYLKDFLKLNFVNSLILIIILIVFFVVFSIPFLWFNF